jgi:hypothetical protein
VPITVAAIEVDGLAENGRFLFDGSQTIVATVKHVGCDLLANPIAGAQILIDPDHELGWFSHRSP